MKRAVNALQNQNYQDFGLYTMAYLGMAWKAAQLQSRVRGVGSSLVTQSYSTEGVTPITKNSVIEGYKVSNHAWRKSGLGRGASEELISQVITGARNEGTVIIEEGNGKFSGNIIMVYNYNGVNVAIDETRQIIMSIRPEKGFKLP